MSAQGTREDVPRNPEDARTPEDAVQAPEGAQHAPEEPAEAGPAAPASEPGAEGPVPREQLAAGEDMQQIVTRWKEIQAQFVDEPKSAVAKADALVVETLERLAGMFERERSALEQRWSGSGETPTEELRQSLLRYRALFERILAA